MKVKLTKEYLKKIKVSSNGEYDIELEKAKVLVDAGNAEYMEEAPAEEKEVKTKKTKVLKPHKKRGYKTK